MAIIQARILSRALQRPVSIAAYIPGDAIDDK